MDYEGKTISNGAGRALGPGRRTTTSVPTIIGGVHRRLQARLRRVPDRDGRAESTARIYRRPHAGDWRYRTDEHHAGLGGNSVREKSAWRKRWAHTRHISSFSFSAEAMAITFAGGLAGIAIAYLISWGVGALPLMSAFGENLQAGDIHLHINVGSLMVATIILCLVGIISGMVPAVRAARLDSD